MLMFIDKAFTIILLLCTILIIPISLLVALSVGRAITEIYFEDSDKKLHIIDKFFYTMLITIITVIEVTVLCSLVYLVYRMGLAFISDKIIFFNI